MAGHSVQRYAIREKTLPAFRALLFLDLPITFLRVVFVTFFLTNMASKEQIPSPAQGVGPIYRPDGEKPTATVSKEVSYDNVHVLPQTPQLIALLT